MKRNKIYLGDCLELMPKHVEDKSVDMIFCDLPYGTTQNKWDSVIPFEPLWEQYKRVIKDNGAIVLFGSQPFTSALIMSEPKMFKYSWYWLKNRATGVLNSKKQPLRNIEEICVFNIKKYNPQGLIEVNQPSRNSKKDYDNYGKGTSKQYTQKYTNYPKQLIEFNSVQRTTHPTEKPLDLIEYMIKTYTNEGDLILDNTCGSGTTGRGAKNLNRDYIMMEQEEKYYDIACKRLLT